MAMVGERVQRVAYMPLANPRNLRLPSSNPWMNIDRPAQIYTAITLIRTCHSRSASSTYTAQTEYRTIIDLIFESSPVHSGSDSSRSRSRSRGALVFSFSYQDVQFSNSRLASIMLGAEPGPPEPPLLRQPSPIRSPPLPPQELDQPPASNRPRSSSDRRGSPSAQSRRTWDSGLGARRPFPSNGWKCYIRVALLPLWRATADVVDGQEITNFLFNSDGQSVRTRQSISDLGHDESTLQISRSPPSLLTRWLASFQ
ncbi:hypothetical protein BJ912DRAFT_250463 [Pholiota molesta]|nr:hypothetical protein BJ912DRAFT_250463 [Pholiota molesta]